MTPKEIKQALDSHFNTDIAKIKRSQEYLLYRDLYFDLCLIYCYPNYSLSSIAKEVNRDHSTFVYFNKKEVRYPEHKELLNYFKNKFGPVISRKTKTFAEELQIEINNLREEIEHYKNSDFEKLKSQFEALKERHENLKNQKNDFTNRLNEFPVEVQESIKARFSLILDMESRKFYSYSEKRRSEIKTD